jgi:hypothetical protein
MLEIKPEWLKCSDARLRLGIYHDVIIEIEKASRVLECLGDKRQAQQFGAYAAAFEQHAAYHLDRVCAEKDSRTEQTPDQRCSGENGHVISVHGRTPVGEDDDKCKAPGLPIPLVNQEPSTPINGHAAEALTLEQRIDLRITAIDHVIRDQKHLEADLQRLEIARTFMMRARALAQNKSTLEQAKRAIEAAENVLKGGRSDE